MINKGKYPAFFCVLLSLIIISSCAIHRKFPFICFRKECVLNQLGYYELKKLGKQAKINATVRKNKRKKRRNRNSGSATDKSSVIVDSKKNDSLSYKGGRSVGICRETKLIVTLDTIRQDTLIVYYPDHEKSLSDAEKNKLKDYVQKNGAVTIKEMLIKNCHNKNVLSEHENLWLSERARKLIKYLKTLDVPSSKIKTEE